MPESNTDFTYLSVLRELEKEVAQLAGKDPTDPGASLTRTNAWFKGTVGGLLSFATAYLPEGEVAGVIERLKRLDGIEAALTRAEAAARYELPAERIGEIVVVSTRHKVLGTSVSRHDLSGLTEPLRSHGGVSEQKVPLIANRRADLSGISRLRNFDIFDVVLNRVAA